jgi:manganese/iron transport system permease protein/iron/zinc/copper transport system permease protein
VGSLLDPYQFEFFRNGLLVATLAGALCGLVGTYVVLKGMSYIGHGLSHAIFGGFAVATLVGVSYYVGALVWGLAAALAIGVLTRRRALGSDAVIGVVTTASFAIGLVLEDQFGGSPVSFDAALFGSILGVQEIDVLVMALAFVGAVTVVFFAYRRLLFTTFDPEVANVSGVRVARTEALLMVVLAICILVTMQVVGVTLLAATLVIPPTVARMLTHRFAVMLWLATGIGALCGFVGMNLSYHRDWKTGPTIVLVGTVLFVAVLAISGSRGLRRAASVDAHPA